MILSKAAPLYRALDLHNPEVSVVLCDDETIHALNRQWRAEDKPTDVLSFPLWEPSEGPMPADIDALGDIIISLDTAARQVAAPTHRDRVAGELGVAPESLAWGLEQEVLFLLIHGLLHLLGHDHAEPGEEAVMKAEERRLWEATQQG